MRVAAIDVGTNSVHLLVADVAPDGTWTVVEKARHQVELGSGGLTRNKIAPAAFQRGLDAMEAIRQATDSLGVQDIHCAATSAVREAANGSDWTRAVHEQTGIRVRVIPGREEGRIIYLGVRGDLDFTTGKAMLMDLGGGSTEFIVCGSDGPGTILSLPLGHIRLADGYPGLHGPGREAYDALKSHIKRIMKPLTEAVRPRDFRTLVGTSGTLRCLATMATLARGEKAPEHQHGLVLKRSEVDALVKRLRSTPASSVRDIPGVDPKRQHTITAGAILVRQVMRAFDQDELITSERSLRDGLIADWIVRNRPEIDLLGTHPDPKARSVRRLMDRYGVDHAHAVKVRELALRLFDDLAPAHRMGWGERELLQYAAMVHDVGHHISGKNHNKHGQYLIRHSRMSGFTAPEIALLGNLVRYHRGGKPKQSHADFASLPADDQRVVRVLAGILRIADALDRSHDSPIHQVRAHLNNGQVSIEATARHEAHLEHWAVSKRTELLESSLQQQVTIDISVAPDAGEAMRPIG